MPRYSPALSLCLLAGLGHASCGSSFCTVNTNWDTQGLSHDSGLLMDLRYTYAKADQWRAGSARKGTAAANASDSEIEDKATVNQLANLNLDYAINRKWAVLLGLPFVLREHEHTFDSSIVGPFTQQATFKELSDIRVQAKYRFDSHGDDASTGLRFGVKLPTGATNKLMTPTDPRFPDVPYKLERSGQPGTGSTDVILGAHHFRNAPGKGFGWFISGQLQLPVAIKDNYRPGKELNLDVGIHYEVAQGLNLLLQINGQHRSRDTGVNANPASGGHSVNLSPGLSYALTPQSQLYAYVQRPIVQYLNTDPADSASGQLAARWTATAGMTHRF